mmetsp:Transcript_142216/g.261985  ORF Transcript_142216/g.261985 Transcript_142216/m.261985 type:complete len:168 (-) Transcript_142216:615-1118(-)
METGALNVETSAPISAETEAPSVGTSTAARESVTLTWLQTKLLVGLTAGKIAAPAAVASEPLFEESAPRTAALWTAVTAVETVVGSSAEEKIFALGALSGRVTDAVVIQACKRNLMMCEIERTHLESHVAVTEVIKGQVTVNRPHPEARGGMIRDRLQKGMGCVSEP